MPSNAYSVLISGIGIAGPTLAYFLAHQGCDVTLVERAPRLRAGGYVIDFWGIGYDIAERMQLVPDLERVGYHVDELRFVDSRGRQTGGFGGDVFERLTGGRYVSLPRSALAQLLYQSVAARCECLFSDSIADMTIMPDKVLVTFEHAPPRQFDWVIGADGLHSRVRRLAFGPQDQFDADLGYLVAAFEVEGYRPRDENVYVSYAAPGRQVARFALHGDRTMFLLLSASAEPADRHDRQAQKVLLHAQFDDAGWECSQILAGLDRCEDFYFEPVRQIRMPRWWRSRVACIGDAAFAPSPLAGQGAALAMISAYVLAGELGEDPNAHEHAFARYDSRLRDFMYAKQRSAARFAGFVVPKTRWGITIRNQVSKLLRLPVVANLVMGQSLTDHLQLPDYRHVPISMGSKPRRVNAVTSNA